MLALIVKVSTITLHYITMWRFVTFL